MTTAYNAWSIRLRGDRIEGKNDPVRSFGFDRVTSPALVVNNRGRARLRSVVRDSVRS